MKKIKVAITGANGYLASMIQKYNQNDFEFIPIKRKDISLEDLDQVKNFFTSLDFDVLLHTAACTATKECEKNPEKTRKINFEATKIIADICKERNKRLIFFSSEQCFNGETGSGPFKEDFKLNSCTNYGKQKIEADQYIQNNLKNYVILRLSWMMGMDEIGVKASPNIIKRVLNCILYDSPDKFTFKEKRGMTYSKNLVLNFKNIIYLNSGVYNFTTTNHFTTYESAIFIAKALNISEERINKYILPDYDKYNGMHKDIRLDNCKIKAEGILLGTFEEDVHECLKDYGYKG